MTNDIQVVTSTIDKC